MVLSRFGNDSHVDIGGLAGIAAGGIPDCDTTVQAVKYYILDVWMPGDDCDTGFDVLIMNFICGYPCNDGKEGRVCGCGQIVPECAEQINQYINQNGYPAYAEPGKPLGTVDSNYIHTAA